MGKDLHPSILPYILNALNNHQNVDSVDDISTNDHYIFLIARNRGMRDIVMLISDCYHFSEFDYHSKPSQLNRGGFILIARPESSFSSAIQHHVKRDKIIAGKIGILMGALWKDEYWLYEKPDDDKRRRSLSN